MDSLDLGPQATETIITLFTTLSAPIDRQLIGEIIDEQGWTIVAELDGEAIIADGAWGTGGGEIVITFDGGTVGEIAIGLITSADNTRAAQQEAGQVYHDGVQMAVERLGQPSGTRTGSQPRTWFDLPNGTIIVGNDQNASTISWWSPEHAAKVMKNFTANEGE